MDVILISWNPDLGRIDFSGKWGGAPGRHAVLGNSGAIEQTVRMPYYRGHPSSAPQEDPKTNVSVGSLWGLRKQEWYIQEVRGMVMHAVFLNKGAVARRDSLHRESMENLLHDFPLVKTCAIAPTQARGWGFGGVMELGKVGDFSAHN